MKRITLLILACTIPTFTSFCAEDFRFLGEGILAIEDNTYAVDVWYREAVQDSAGRIVDQFMIASPQTRELVLVVRFHSPIMFAGYVSLLSSEGSLLSFDNLKYIEVSRISMLLKTESNRTMLVLWQK